MSLAFKVWYHMKKHSEEYINETVPAHAEVMEFIKKSKEKK
jgi:hypothetical protein